uniref:Poly A polymerase head domain-containing protein n=1 Tax=Trichuris muris TaxID=70415 RepID=A0A5S6QSK7_TRIMR
MKLDSPEFHSLLTAELLEVKRLFDKHQYEIRIAGGAVRDLLMGIRPGDVDLATTATPDQMIEMFNSENVRMLNKRGEKHGTVTCRINDAENFEITTLRVDILCDGRRAEVEFTTDWMLDASRRDLTVNSMFLGFDGTVFDYFGGLDDVEKKRVAFVGDPEKRIQEDYLRILRYFRFYGRVADLPNKHEESTLEAIRTNVKGLQGISGERIWVELKKIVVGRYADTLVRVMLECGIGPYIGLGNDGNIEEFCRVYCRSKDLEPEPMTVLSALLTSEDEVYTLDDRLKLSSHERILSVFIVLHRGEAIMSREEEARERYFKHLCFEPFAHKAESDSKRRVCELIKYIGDGVLLNKLQQWNPPVFPIRGTMIVEEKYRKGPIMSMVLAKLFEKWRDSDFKLTVEELLDSLEDLPSPESLQSEYATLRKKFRWKKHRRS